MGWKGQERRSIWHSLLFLVSLWLLFTKVKHIFFLISSTYSFANSPNSHKDKIHAQNITDNSRGSQSNKFRSTCGSFQVQEGVALALASRHLAQWPTSSGIWSGHFAEAVHATNCPSVSVLTAKNQNKRSEVPAAFSLLTRFDGLLVFLPPRSISGTV